MQLQLFDTTKIIGIAGKAGSGKDTACGFIQEWAEEMGHTAQRDAFADRLKISAARALGRRSGDDEIGFCNGLKEKGAQVRVTFPDYRSLTITGREYLQLYGTEAHRDVFGDDFWIDQVLAKERPGIDYLVVTDVRFPNEAQAIKDRRGEVWEIMRNGSGAGNHASEQRLPAELVDIVISNNGPLEALRANVQSILDVDRLPMARTQ